MRWSWGGLLLVGCGAFIGCSDAESPTSDSPLAGAGPMAAGAGGGAGGPSTPTGGTPSGAAGSNTQAGAASGAGGAAAGSPSGGSAAAGTFGDVAGTSNGGHGGAASGAGGGGGSSGAGGSAGSGGSGSIAGKLDGFGWVMKCNKADTSPDAENRCYLLPQNGQGQCGGGYTSVDETIQFGGTPGTVYMVAMHLRGSQEAGDYSGGMQLTKEFLKNATHNDLGVHNFMSMDVSSPKATYFPNAGAGGGTVVAYDYKVTIPIEGGATIHLKAFDKDCLQHRFCPDKTYMNCGYVLDPYSPKGSPIDGDFMFIAVDSVTPM